MVDETRRLENELLGVIKKLENKINIIRTQPQLYAEKVDKFR